MKKMYTDAKKSRAQSAVSKTSEASTRIPEDDGDDDDGDDDEDFELLEWAAQLDYEQYLTDWASTASTAHSDAV